MCNIKKMKKRPKTGTKEMEEKIIDILATGLKTADHLKEKHKISAQYRLPQLENQGVIKVYHSKGWGPGRRKRSWGLTVKGFLKFLSKHRKSAGPILQAVTAYQDLLTYRVTIIPEENVGTREVPDIVIGPPREVDVPVLPIRLQSLFRERLGDEMYVMCLTWRSPEITPMYDYVLDTARSRFVRGKNTIPSDDRVAHFPTEDTHVRTQAHFEQEYCARAFTRRFLGNAFGTFLRQTFRQLRVPSPNKEWYDRVKAMYDEELSKLNQQMDTTTQLCGWALNFFNPDRTDWRNRAGLAAPTVPGPTGAKEIEDVRERLFGFRRDESGRPVLPSNTPEPH